MENTQHLTPFHLISISQVGLTKYTDELSYEQAFAITPWNVWEQSQSNIVGAIIENEFVLLENLIHHPDQHLVQKGTEASLGLLYNLWKTRSMTLYNDPQAESEFLYFWHNEEFEKLEESVKAHIQERDQAWLKHLHSDA